MRGKVARSLRRVAAVTNDLEIPNTEWATNTTQRRKFYQFLKKEHNRGN